MAPEIRVNLSPLIGHQVDTDAWNAFMQIHKRTGDKFDIEAGKYLLKAVHSAFMENGKEPLLAYGTMLGAIREASFISFDSDIDLMIRENDIGCITSVVDCLKNKGISLLRIVQYEKGNDSTVSFGYPGKKGGAYLDLCIYLLNKNGVYVRGLSKKDKLDIDKEDFDNPLEVLLYGEAYKTVRYPAKYLEKWYGSDWRTPIPDKHAW